jgi:hypothetical protein
VGDYRISPLYTLHIRREGDHLLSTSGGDTPTPLYAKNDHQFFARIRQLQYSFDLDAAGRATAIVLTGPAGGPGNRFPRISAADG